MSDVMYAPCPNPTCEAVVKPWPDEVPFCCHPCWNLLYLTEIRPDLAVEGEELPAHSEQCIKRQDDRRKELAHVPTV